MNRSAVPLRGQVYHVDMPRAGSSYWVVVSNNARNAHTDDVLAAMITSSAPRSPRPSYVPLARGMDPFDGWVKCDRLGRISKDELGPVKGGISRPTMHLVDIGLAFALGLSRPA